MSSTLTNATLEWDAAGWPRSLTYGDIYYSSADALGESTHVFLQGNRLAERWRALRGRHFVVGELGFGAGLNFLNACRLWCAEAPAGATLHYVACELHPLTTSDMRRVHAQWPELGTYSAALLLQYPDHTAGVHQLVLRMHGREIRLTLLYGDAAALLAGLYRADGFRVDAWFLDGFAPRLNPALWEPQLLRTLARLSKPGSTAATYSVAGEFRRSLAEAGFVVRKIRGYASKREMLQAELPGAAAPSHSNGKRICIVGGGLAGCSTAHALAQSGWEVLLLEQETALATQSSGNPQGILHCNLSTLDSASNQFNLHAFLYATRYYEAFAATAPDIDWHRCGMLQVAVIPRLQKRFRQLAESRAYAPALMQYLQTEDASALAGLALSDPALHFPASGWLSPPALCKAWAAHPGIAVQTGTRVAALEQVERGWRLGLVAGRAQSTLEVSDVMLCNAADLHSFDQTRHYPVIGNRGQVDVYAAPMEPQVRMIVSGQGYVLPATNGRQSIGGSYYVGGSTPEAVAARTREHLDFAAQLDPRLAEALAKQPLVLQRQGLRCVTPDRMPLAGPVHKPAEAGGGVWEGLYVNVGHGSHGLTRTPYCAAWLASLLNGTPPPFTNELMELVLPARF